MSKITLFFKKYQSALKSLFFISVLILVLIELNRLKKTISLDAVLDGFSALNLWQIVLLIVAGLLAVLPMTAYDVLLNRRLKTNYSTSYILESSWAINTINNLAGFAGLVDIGLRYSFYVDQENEELGRQEISRIIPYFMTGFSLISGLTVPILLLGQFPSSLKIYWPLLFAIFLYLPILYFLSGRKQLHYFGSIPTKDRLLLLLASSFDWMGVLGTFILVGNMLGLAPVFYQLIPLLLIAHAIGMVSMIPGGIGSFDLFVISGLTNLGVTNTKAIVWLLLFRIVYYIIPFSIGFLLFLKQMGGHINAKFLGLPKQLTENFLQGSQIFLLRLYGFFLILVSLSENVLSAYHWLNRIAPIHRHLLWKFPSVLLGILFILLARLIQNKVKRAFPFGVLLILLGLFYISLSEMPWASSVLLLISLISLIINRKDLNRQRFSYAREDLTKDGAIVFTAFFLYLTTKGVAPHHLHVHDNLAHYLGLWLHISLLVLLTVAILISILRLVTRGQEPFGEPLEKQRYQDLLEKFGGESDSGLAFLGDKKFYWYEDTVVFQFAQEGNKLIVMGEPIGNPSYFAKAIEDFLYKASQVNLEVIFYEIGQETTLRLHEHGYDFMKFGETAMINLTQFSIEGKHGRKFRTVLNKLNNQGYHFDVVQPPFSDDFLQQLVDVSDSWLNGRQEKGFSLGFFDKNYLQLAPIATVTNQEGELIAFANFMPAVQETVGTIDLMRHDRTKAPNGVMDYLFINLFLYFKDEGKESFDIGMAPLSNVGNLSNSFFQERIAYLIYSFSSRFYSFAGLRSYKDKFSPIWTARYIAYPRHTWIVYNMLTIFQVDNKKVKLMDEY